MSKRAGAIALILVGAVLTVVGVAGAAGHWGRTTDTAGASPVAPRATTTIAPAANAPGAVQFVHQLDAALASGDTTFTFAHLHPAVIARYGAEQCRAYLAALKDRSRHFLVKGSPTVAQDYVYASDGQSTVVPGVIRISVDVVTPSSSTPSAVHTVAVDGVYRWFTDCGAALHRG